MYSVDRQVYLLLESIKAIIHHDAVCEECKYHYLFFVWSLEKEILVSSLVTYVPLYHTRRDKCSKKETLEVQV